MINTLDLAFKLHDQILNFWNFFIAFTTILVSWVFSRERKWSHSKRLIITIAFILFAILNLTGLIPSHKTLEIIINELNNSEPTVLEMNSKMLHSMTNYLTRRFWELSILLHIIIDSFMIYTIYIISSKEP